MTNLSIQTNAANDIFLNENGDLAMARDLLAVQQDCEHAMKAQFGEMFLEPLEGMPNLADIWRSKNFIKWEAAARRTLSSVDGVVKVTSFVMQTEGDTFIYTAQILTVYSSSLIVISDTLES